MNILIAGAGAVGRHLARLLELENHDITLMDEDKGRLINISDNSDIISFEGKPASIKDLTDISADKADLFIAVTPEESTNITACMLASRLGAKKTVARINNYEYLLPKNMKFFEELGINSLIYPEIMAAREIEMAMRTPWTRFWWDICNGMIILLGAKVRDNAPIANKHLYEINQENKQFHIVAIKRGNDTIIPSGNDRVLNNDIVYITTLRKYLDNLPELLGKKSFETKRLMFMGGSEITVRTIKQLPSNIDIKVIERDRDIAKMLVEKLPSNVTVFVEDARNAEFLEREGIADSDAFLALTGNSEANILGCMMAKEYGVRKTVAEVENIDYIAMAERLDIGTVINKKLITASKIYELLLKADASNIKSLTFADANVGEVTAQPHSKITKKLIKDLKLLDDITLGALIRDGNPILIDGNTMIEPNDKVVVFFLNRSLKKIEMLFN